MTEGATAGEALEPIGFELLYESGPVLVVSKPAGLLTQAPPGIDSLEVRVRRFLQRREGKTHQLYLAVAHRLDRPVSGALVVTRHVRAAQRIAKQFQDRTIEKAYWALVEGTVANDSGEWIDWMRKVPEQARSEVVDRAHPEAQEAILRYSVRGREAGVTHLEIQLETGRTHQIRVQAAARGWPVAGDELYGAARPFGPPSDDARARWIALHARRIRFEHPMTRERVEVVAPLPAAWRIDALPIEEA